MRISDWSSDVCSSDLPNILQSQIDNTQGDAIFTLPNRFTTEGNTSTTLNPALDALIVNASQATGEERQKLFREAFRMIALDEINRSEERSGGQESVSTCRTRWAPRL